MLVSMLIHEPLELLAIPGVAEIFHEFREFALGGDELLAFFFQPREFSCAPFVESAISVSGAIDRTFRYQHSSDCSSRRSMLTA